jgi:hypothetical protein
MPKLIEVSTASTLRCREDAWKGDENFAPPRTAKLNFDFDTPSLAHQGAQMKLESCQLRTS